MSDEQIKVDLDPKKVLAALKDMGEAVKRLSDDIDNSLGKKAAKDIGKLEEAAEKGTTKIGAFFRNLGTRVREDLKTAFDATGVMAGMKFGKDVAEGVKQVFEMERAFDRLNTRLKLTASEMDKFKTAVGRRVAGTGQKLEDVLPGVETAAAKGGIKSPAELASVAEMLGQAKATTGEGTEGISSAVVEILKSQGEKVTAASFKKTLDALQATRTQGAFKTAGDAGNAIQNIAGLMSPEQARKMGLGTREMGGLAAMASRGGDHGQDILKHILETATQAGGKQSLNAIFGTQLFKNGKMDVGAFQNIDKKRFGQYSEQALSSATGANQADLSRFLDSMKSGMKDFDKVTSGANETASQFQEATDNLASKIDRFKEGMKESGREIGEGVSGLAKDIMSGNFSKMGSDVKQIGSKLWENKGNVAAGLGLSAGVGMLMGGGLNSILSKVPGGGMLKGAAGAEIAKQTGVTPVFVTNAKDIGGGGMPGMAGASGMLAKGASLVGAAAIGVEIGNAIMGTELGKRLTGQATDYLHEKMYGSDSEQMSSAEREQTAKNALAFNERNGTNMSIEDFAKAVETGTLKAHKASKQNVNYTNPSDVTGRGPGM